MVEALWILRIGPTKSEQLVAEGSTGTKMWSFMICKVQGGTGDACQNDM